MPKFVPGLKLSELYYNRVVAKILEKRFPGMRYSAGLIGPGSEVLGYDTTESTDHHWGLRLLIFLDTSDWSKRQGIDDALRDRLPLTFLGYPTSFGKPDKIGVRLPDSSKREGSVDHFITLTTIDRFLKSCLGLGNYRDIDARVWLGLSEQGLLEVTSGQLFHDGLRIKSVISEFDYYPRDVWLYKMASRWQKISEEEAFVGRTSAVGDELGSRIISSRIVEELMQLCFLMERRYAPYSKWFGTAFSKLQIARDLEPVLKNALESNSIIDREKYLSKAYHIVAEKHNSLRITRRITATVSRYYKRPYMVIHADMFASEIRKRIKDKGILEAART